SPAASPPAAAPAAAAPAAPATERRFASPLARRMAAAAGLDLAAVGGSGPNGRIVKSDIEAALARGPAARPVAAPSAGAAPTAPAAPSAVGLPPFTEVPNSQTRKVIARRLGESKRDAPHFYLSIDCEIDQLLKIRQELNGRAGDKYKLSVNDFVIRASALALKQIPAA